MLLEETSTFFLARRYANLPFATRNLGRVSSREKEETLHESRQPGIDDMTQRPLTQADGRPITVSPSLHLPLAPLRVPQRSFHETNGHKVTLGVSRGIENGGRRRRINRNRPAEPKNVPFSLRHSSLSQTSSFTCGLSDARVKPCLRISRAHKRRAVNREGIHSEAQGREGSVGQHQFLKAVL